VFNKRNALLDAPPLPPLCAKKKLPWVWFGPGAYRAVSGVRGKAPAVLLAPRRRTNATANGFFFLPRDGMSNFIRPRGNAQVRFAGGFFMFERSPAPNSLPARKPACPRKPPGSPSIIAACLPFWLHAEIIGSLPEALWGRRNDISLFSARRSSNSAPNGASRIGPTHSPAVNGEVFSFSPADCCSFKHYSETASLGQKSGGPCPLDFPSSAQDPRRRSE